MSEELNIPEYAKQIVYRYGCAMAPKYLASTVIEAEGLIIAPEIEDDLIAEIELAQETIKEALEAEDDLTRGDIIPTLREYDEDELDYIQG